MRNVNNYHDEFGVAINDIDGSKSAHSTRIVIDITMRVANRLDKVRCKFVWRDPDVR